MRCQEQVKIDSSTSLIFFLNPVHRVKDQHHQGSQFKPSSCKVKVNKRTATYIVYSHLIITSQIGEALGHKNNSLSILRSSLQCIFTKLLHSSECIMPIESSPTWPKKFRNLQVLSCNEKHCGTNIGSTQFSWSSSLIPLAVPY